LNKKGEIMANQAVILGHVSFEDHRIGEKYDVADVQKDFGSIEAWGTYPLYDRVKVVKRENSHNKAIRVKYPKGKVRFLESGACWLWKNFGEHRDLYLGYWVKFSDVFMFRAGGKMHGFCGGACNTGGNKPNGHDGWSSRVHWGKDGTIKQYIYHKDQPGKFGDVIFWRHNPETIIIGEGESLNQNKKQNVYLKRGQWHFIVTRVVVNDIGEKNGFIQSWLDGELVLDVYGFEFRNKSCKKDDLLIDKMYFCTFFGGRTADYKPVKNEYADFTDFRISKGLYCPPEIKCQGSEPKIVLKKPEPMLFDADVPNRAGKYGYGIRLEWIVPPDVKPAFYEIQFTTDEKPTAGKWITYQADRQASHGAWINHHGDIKFDKYIRCLKSGQIYCYRMRAYDASAKLITGWSNIVSGTNLDYLKLRIKKVEPRLFAGKVPNKSGKYGFGMLIEWLASVHPATAFYEIQYTTDANLEDDTWEILSRNRSKKYVWINHVGQELFGHYVCCLPSGQQYWYRARPLNKDNKPLADWSNIVSGVITEYRRVSITKV
jgi:hypothetical protein